MGFIFKVVSFIGGWFALGVLALAISAGLYIACDFAEEYSSIVKRYLTRSIYGISSTFVILMIDGLPFSRCLFGIISHLSYLSLLTTFPFVTPVSLPTIGSFAITVVNHILWFRYFISEEYRYSIQYNEGITNMGMRVLGFLFIFVWIVPIAFFVSLQSIEESLPMMSSMSAKPTSAVASSHHQHQQQQQQQYNQNQQYNQYSYGGEGGEQHQYNNQYNQGQQQPQTQQTQQQYSYGHRPQGQKKKGGIFKGLVDSVLEKKEQAFPGVSKRKY